MTTFLFCDEATRRHDEASQEQIGRPAQGSRWENHYRRGRKLPEAVCRDNFGPGLLSGVVCSLMAVDVEISLPGHRPSPCGVSVPYGRERFVDRVLACPTQ